MNRDALVDTIRERLCNCEDTLDEVGAVLEELRALVGILKGPAPRNTKKPPCPTCNGEKGWYAPGLHRGEPERWIQCNKCSRKGKKKGAVKNAIR